MSAQRADPAFVRYDDSDRLALDQRLLDRGLVVLGRLGKAGAALAERRLAAECSRTSLICGGDLLPLLVLGADERVECFALGAQLLVLLADLHLLELAQVAQPHVEDGVGLHVGELEGRHQHGLGLVLVADDLDDLVEVQIGDDEATEHLEPMIDLLEPEARAPQQHLAAMVEPFAQRLRQVEDLGARPFTSTFILSGMRLSSSVSLNSDSISSSGSTVRARGSMTRRTSSADSSRTSATNGSFLSLSSSPNFSSSRPFCTAREFP